MACSLCGGVVVGLVCPVDQPFSVLLAYSYSMAVQVDINVKAFMYSTIYNISQRELNLCIKV